MRIRTIAILIALFALSPLAPAQTTRPATSPALRVEAADQPTPKVTRRGAPDTGFMRLHAAYVAKAKAGGIDLYMEGDSITDFWEHKHKANWQRAFAGWKAADFGISGDRTQHVLWRIENGELEGVNPKVIVLMIGTNNLPANTVYGANTVDETFDGVKAIVAKMQELAPAAHILVLGVFPREDKPLGDKIKALNDKIATLDDGKLVKYLNINDHFTNADGKLLPGVMLKDKLHPDEKGYDAWAAAIRPQLTEWLGPPVTAAAPAGGAGTGQ
jgi:lysophospholipase L1-like esterase